MIVPQVSDGFYDKAKNTHLNIKKKQKDIQMCIFIFQL